MFILFHINYHIIFFGTLKYSHYLCTHETDYSPNLILHRRYHPPTDSPAMPPLPQEVTPYGVTLCGTDSCICPRAAWQSNRRTACHPQNNA